MEKIIILGASQLQVPAIKKAKEYGMYVVACDYNPKAVGFSLVDEPLLVSTIDKEAVLKEAMRIKPDFIITSTSDAPVCTVAYVCERLGMPIDISYEDAICATVKSAMRERFKSHGLAIPEYYTCSDFNEFREAVNRLNHMNGKCIIKPSDSAASRGVKLLTRGQDDNALKLQYEICKAFSRNEIIMVEEFMEGPEVSIECIIVNRKVSVIAITDKLVTDLPYFVEIGHSQQSMLSDVEKNNIVRLATAGIKALGIINGVAHAEIKVTSKGPKIVEIAARLGGDYITSKLVPLSAGIDMVGVSLDIALRRDTDYTAKYQKGSAIRFLYATPGIIRDISISEAIKDIPGIEEVKFYCNIGDPVKNLHSSNDRLGHIIGSGENAQEAINSIEKAMKLIKLSISEK